MGTSKALVSKVGGYGLSMLLLALASIAIIPLYVTTAGDRGWGAIVLGQAIGGIAGVATGLGWGIDGPSRVARAAKQDRRSEYTESLLARAIIFVPVTTLSIGVAIAIAPGQPVLATLGVVQAAVTGFTANWYFIGTSSPYSLLASETVPRVTLTILAVLAMSQGGSAEYALAIQSTGMVLAVVVSTLVIARRTTDTRWILRESPSEIIRNQWDGVRTSVSSSLFMAAPMVLVSLLAPSSQPLYALIDKTQKQISGGLAPALNIAQGWIPAGEGTDTGRRARRALLLSGTVSLGLILVAFLTAPAVFSFLGAGKLAPNILQTALYSIIIGLALFESILARAALSSLSQLRSVARIATTSFLLSIPVFAFAAWQQGATGALATSAAVLLCKTVAGLVVLRRRLAIPKNSNSNPTEASENDSPSAPRIGEVNPR